MSVTEEVLNADEAYARNFKLGHLPMPPSRKLAILACMDARLTVEQFCGLKTGEAHIIRNAGGIATDDALRSLIISHHLLGTQEFIVINQSHRLRHGDLQGRSPAQATGAEDRIISRRAGTFPRLR